MPLPINFVVVTEREVLRVNPEVMRGVSHSVSGAAKDLHTKLNELDGQVREMLVNWRGGAGGAYGQAWDQWHRGAGEVQQGLALLAEAVAVAAADFAYQDSAATQNVDGVYRG